ncbi:hypothetical protein RUM44_003318 [Polyplax serrata]|uniref:Mediator of RNA polymerase II transcription subunit 15 n=1 Tax=Polyplax serrata TaxID=468196 RepID=A0ABR1AGL1_POLSC
MAAEDNHWKSAAFRQSVVAKIDDAVARSGMQTSKNSMEMENHVFQKAKTKEEYLAFVARLILHIREMSKESKNSNSVGGSGVSGQMIPDPINALQTLARQGTGNNQMMNINSGEITTGSVGMVRQPPPQNAATNLLQSLNQRPAPNAMMGLPSVQNKIAGINMVPVQQTSSMGQIPVPTMNTQIHPTMQGQLNAQMNMAIAPQIHPQLNHIQQRKAGEMIIGNQQGSFLGPRNAPPNQFLRQSPSPSAVSPVGVGSNQMAVSPALVPSPSSSQLTPVMSGPPRSNGMASSPSNSLNTPGQSVATPSPGNLLEEQQYREKVRQLSKYIEPLRKMIAKMGNDDVEKLSKMKKLLEILSNPSKRMPLETLRKCEVVLEKLDLKRGEGSVGPHTTALKEIHNLNPLLEAVSNCLQTSINNHTLQRTFGPTLEALFGPEMKMLPTPLEPKLVDETKHDIPEVLQGEIARLDQRFKVSLDNTQQLGSKIVRLICWLDDKHLPCVPPISISIPEDYPKHPPCCILSQHEYMATDFLMAIHKALSLRIRKLPSKFSLSQLLDTWEMSVRQASAPIVKSPSTVTLLMAL